MNRFKIIGMTMLCSVILGCADSEYPSTYNGSAINQLVFTKDRVMIQKGWDELRTKADLDQHMYQYYDGDEEYIKDTQDYWQRPLSVMRYEDQILLVSSGANGIFEYSSGDDFSVVLTKEDIVLINGQNVWAKD